MEKQIRITHRISRFIGWCVFAVAAIPGLIAPFGVLADGGEIWVIPVAVVGFLGFAFALGGCILYRNPRVVLTADGVLVKMLFSSRFYLWEQISQAGILYLLNRNTPINYIALLVNGTPKRKPYDQLFQLCNLGNIVYIPYSQELLNFVTAHYGMIDFNFKDGREVQSYAVAEVPAANDCLCEGGCTDAG